MLAALAGGLVGAGVLVLAVGLLPARRPDLAAALARLDSPAPARPLADDTLPEGLAGLRGRLSAGVLHRLRRVRLPDADLALLREDPDVFLLRKATLALVAFLAPAAALSALALVGLRLPVVVPLGVALGAGLVGFLAPDLAVRSRARTAREEFRRAAGAYLDLVALERAADGGPAEALHRAAEVGHGWAFVRIRDALDHARLAGRPPWEGLSDLAREVGVARPGRPRGHRRARRGRRRRGVRHAAGQGRRAAQPHPRRRAGRRQRRVRADDAARRPARRRLPDPRRLPRPRQGAELNRTAPPVLPDRVADWRTRCPS